MNTAPDITDEIRPLLRRLNYGAEGAPLRIIAFIAARPGEGTSTIAQAYAAVLAAETGRKILLLQAGENGRSGQGIIDAALKNTPLQLVARETAPGLFRAAWVTETEHHAAIAKLLQERLLWQELLALYDMIVIDAPSLQSSFAGVALCAAADATLLVVEAEKTPVPVVENLKQVLQSAEVTLQGVVMNRRQHYIPEKRYKKL